MTIIPRITGLGRVLAMAGALGAAPAPAHAPVPAHAPSPVMPSEIAFRMVTSGGGPRPIITARVNGHPIRMMIHSNAGFFAQIRHGQAAAFGVRLTGEHRRFGIDRPGHVSDLGDDKGVVDRLAIGRSIDRDVPISVFEVPQSDMGMLGVGWIGRSRLILDYAARRAAIFPTPAIAAAKRRALIRAGYVALPMTYDDGDRRYWVMTRINGVTRRMAIATASELTIDSAFARAARLGHGRDIGEGSGPTGTHVAEYGLAAPVRITIGAWTSPPIATGSIHDIYAYIDEKRPADPDRATGGYLGGAFLLKTGAVIDFGSRTLYLRGPRAR